MQEKHVELMCAAAASVLALACAMIVAPAFAQGFGGGANTAQIEAARTAPTPRLNGKPDLTGFWGAVVEANSGGVTRSADGKTVQFEVPPPFAPRAGGAGGAGGRRGGGPAPVVPGGPEPRPPYKQEHLAKVEQLRVTDVDTDPSFVCKPDGVPRAGIPAEIFQSRDAVALIYADGDVRVVPTDGRKFDDTLDPSWYGDSVGRWDGDTLVIQSVNFTDESWLGGGGWFHSDQMKVTEKLSRVGNTLRWEAVVTDPEVLQRPWIVPPRTVVLGKAGGHVQESPPCEDRAQPHMVDKYHITP